MNLKQLEVFIAVAESGSFSRAAEATFITQSTVSQHISTLENYFGVRLLDRTGKGALLTGGGKVLYQHARRVMTDLDEVRQAMRRFSGIEDTELRIGGSNIPATYLIPGLLPLMVERFKGLRLTVIQGDSREIVEKLAREEIELGIVGVRFDDAAFTFTPIHGDAIGLVAGIRHRWSGGKGIEIGELAQEPMVVREAGSGTGRTVSDALAAAGLPASHLKIVACLGSNEAVKHAVAKEVGVAFVSEVSIREELAHKQLSLVKINGFSIRRDFFLVNRAGRALSPAAAAFVDLVNEQRNVIHLTSS